MKIQTGFLALALSSSLVFSGSLALAQDGTKADDKKGTQEREKKSTDTGAKKLDAKKLIAKAIKKYSAFKDFKCDISSATKVMGMAIKGDGTFKYKAKNKIATVTNQKLPMGMTITIQVFNDGTNAWMSQSMPQKVHMKLPADNNMANGTNPFLHALLTGQKEVFEDSSLTVTAEELTVDNVKIERLKMDSGVGIKISLDFNKDTGFMIAQTQTIKQMGNGKPKNRQQMMMAGGVTLTHKFKNNKADSNIPDSEFKFTAPDGSQEVDPGKMRGGGMPGMPGMPGMGKNPFGGGKKKKPEEKKKKKSDDDDEDF